MIINRKSVKDIINENGKVKNKSFHFFMAFLFGGSLGLFGEGVYRLFFYFTILDEKVCLTLTSSIIVFITFLMTSLGIYDKFAKVAGAGLFIPISGFSNAITASSLEGKSEGLIYGVGGKMFSLIGSVFAYGIVSSILLGLIYFIFKVIGNA